MQEPWTISGNIVDVPHRRIFPGTLHIADGHITRIVEDPGPYPTFLIPGFVDAHVHIESSLLVPSEFARLAVIHGTVASVSDPHEIANVLGLAGVEYMLCNGRTTPFKFCFGAPSCVPATAFETAGAEVSLADLEDLLARDEIKYLSEMMNFPGVLYDDPDVHAKLALARRLGKRIDGHAPGLRGDMARRYFAAGISTDHECFTREEAEEKLAYGAEILIREGSAARNFDALWPLIALHPDRVMFCTDDMHPDSLLTGHINKVVRDAVALGVPPLDALQAACVNPVKHYGLGVGLLQAGDPADFVEVDDLAGFSVRRTVIDGVLVAQDGQTLLPRSFAHTVNRFQARPMQASDFAVPASPGLLQVIEALEGQLITRRRAVEPHLCDGLTVTDTARDILKIAVVNRYRAAPIALGFIHGFGLTRGAIASTVAHDSHNIIAVGVTDDALCRAVNSVIAHRGGLAVADDHAESVLPLPVAGLMSNDDGFAVARDYAALDRQAKTLGTPLAAPFMTLSFMALLVIPALKMSDLGLFDGETFTFTPLHGDPT